MIEIKKTMILEDDYWIKVVDQSLKIALVILKNRINIALDKIIEDKQ